MVTQLHISSSDGEWYVTSGHEMIRNHHIAFMALLTGDTMVMKRLYPEWGLEVRLPHFAHGTLLWYCTRHGLFCPGNIKAPAYIRRAYPGSCWHPAACVFRGKTAKCCTNIALTQMKKIVLPAEIRGKPAAGC